jgi:cystine transport system substrate-binding protein
VIGWLSRWRLGQLTRCLAAAGLLLATGAANSPRADWRASGAPLGLAPEGLRVGVDASYPPLAAAAPDGGLFGLEVDLARVLADRLDVPLQLSNTDVGGGLDALAAGRHDLLLAGLTGTPDLLDRAAFSPAYFDDGPRLVTRGEPLLGPDRPLAVELGSAADEAARRRLQAGEAFRLIRVRDYPSLLAGLQSGEHSAALLDPLGASQVLEADSTLQVAARPFESRPLAIAMRRSNRGLQFAVESAFADLRADGTLARLAERWFGL